MTVKAEIYDGRIYVESQYSDRDLAKSLPGSRWNKDRRQWHMPLSWSSCKQLRSTFNERLEIGPELLKWAKDEVQYRVSPSLSLRDALDTEGDEVHYTMAGLYAFQRAGASFLYTAKNALL